MPAGKTMLQAKIVCSLVYAVEHFEVRISIWKNRVTDFTDHRALVSTFLSHLKSQIKG